MDDLFLCLLRPLGFFNEVFWGYLEVWASLGLREVMAICAIFIEQNGVSIKLLKTGVYFWENVVINRHSFFHSEEIAIFGWESWDCNIPLRLSSLDCDACLNIFMMSGVSLMYV